MEMFLKIVLIVIFAPILGGFLDGIDRRISARMQNRLGPPLLQPFYDVIKLFGKESIAVNQTQIAYAFGHLVFAIAALVMLLLGQDLLMLIFILAFSGIFLIVGASSVNSPYSKIGAQREIMQMMAYEPIIVLMTVGVFLITKSFMVSSIFEFDKPLIYYMPLLFIAFLFVLTIKLRKSPFDFSTSHHGHQELIKGVTTEFSGTQLALIEMTHWYDLVLLLGMVSLFFAKPIWVGIIIALVAYFLEIVIDNISARVTWRWMLKLSWVFGLGAALTNIIWLYITLK